MKKVNILELEDLAVGVVRPDGNELTLVDSVSLSVDRGQRVGVVGESGSGKSLTALAALGLTPPALKILRGGIRVDGIELRSASEADRRRVRGGIVGLIPQEPESALNPVFSVGYQLRETIRLHRPVSRVASRAISERLLARVGLEPEALQRAYPHQLSGGQLQRVMIAVALAGDPELLVADEPTTSIDVLNQAEILRLFQELSDDGELALLIITHDLGVIRALVQRVVIMYAGEIIETGPSETLFGRPIHPYTRGLLQAASGLQGRLGPGSRLATVPGTVPQPGSWGRGCRFAPRCPHVQDSCREDHPALEELADGRSVRCPIVLRKCPG